MNYLSTLEISKDLGIPKRTVQSYCKEGFLPALVSLNKGKPCYKIEAHSYLSWKNKNFKGIKRTIEIYEYYFTLYIKGLGKYPSKPLISVDNLRNVLGSY